MPEPLLRLETISKKFGATTALKDITVAINAGEIIGLIGENGAGKSTLIKILSGVHQPDDGTIIWDGFPTRFRNPRQSLLAGIATIHQELANFERLTVSENLLIDEPWPRTKFGGADWKAIHARGAECLTKFD